MINVFSWDWDDWLGDIGDNIVDGLAGAFASADQYMINEAEKHLSGNTGSAGLTTSFDDVSWMQSELGGLLLILVTISVMVAGFQMIHTRDRSEPGKRLIGSLTSAVGISGASIALVSVLAGVADAFAAYIITTNGSYVVSLSSNIKALAESLAGGESAILLVLTVMMVFTLILLLYSLLARPALIVLLTGIWPLSASITNTATGRGWFSKINATLGGLILFKPVAAIIIALGTRMALGTNIATTKAEAQNHLCGGLSKELNGPVQSLSYGSVVGIDNSIPTKSDFAKCIEENADAINQMVQNSAHGAFWTAMAGVVILGLAGLSLAGLIALMVPVSTKGTSLASGAMAGVAGGVAMGAVAVGGSAVGSAVTRVGRVAGRARGAFGGGAGKKGGSGGSPSGSALPSGSRGSTSRRSAAQRPSSQNTNAGSTREAESALPSGSKR
ncbi:MAG: hypothetical protein IKZ87_01540 [Actinomycetaceae bacterium]|nr:hypothetical protein [Actinomycetaceae bacterium]